MSVIEMHAGSDLALLEPKLGNAIFQGLTALGEFLVQRIQDNISRKGPSVPGDYPRSQSGNLAASIEYEVNTSLLELRVRCTAPYGMELEFGDHPFMARSLRESESEAVSIFTETMRNYLK